MRLAIHYQIGQKVCDELEANGRRVNKILFLFGNFYPDLIHSYLWCKHEYQHSREYIRKKIEKLRNRPFLFSFHLGILAHYISDYFCYPHSSVYNKSLFHHIMYELKQKAPQKFIGTKLKIRSFSVEELGRFVSWYEDLRPSFASDDTDYTDFHIAANITTNFLQAAY